MNEEVLVMYENYHENYSVMITEISLPSLIQY